MNKVAVAEYEDCFVGRWWAWQVNPCTDPLVHVGSSADCRGSCVPFSKLEGLCIIDNYLSNQI